MDSSLLSYALTAIVSAICGAAAFSVYNSQLYGTYHLELNQGSPGGSKPVPEPKVEPEARAKPTPQWMNLGFWKDADSFPEACEALALRVIRAARCRSYSCVLDVGFGSGDSLLLFLTHPDVPKPRYLKGITNVKSHHATAIQRVEDARSAHWRNKEIVVDLRCGDAIYRSPRRSPACHPLDPQSPLTKPTSIIAIDCAYHFNTREMFLRQCYERLDESGNVALADMCLIAPKDSLFSWLKTRAVCLVLGVPWANMITPEKYRAQLESIGFVEVSFEDISDAVFPGIIAFLRGETLPKHRNAQTEDVSRSEGKRDQRVVMEKGKGGLELGKMWGLMGSVFKMWWKECGGTYVLVSARKPPIYDRD
ncbi:hypothetical protein FRB94_009355 [Tulasnella sp. JGI-2019a]|nr:hypothetical protein FRB93_008019 [Tulasnella sp. JGI-2019a]KAG8995189.1 hypothetical protein FRB94_009355 [Tulasnella sp. JGI-2019a]